MKQQKSFPMWIRRPGRCSPPADGERGYGYRHGKGCPIRRHRWRQRKRTAPPAGAFMLGKNE